jgi:arginine/serine-rich splicing factor 7
MGRYNDSRSPRRSRSRSRSNERRRSRSVENSSKHETNGSSSDEVYRIHVADLIRDCTERDLDRAFAKFGDLKEIFLAKNPPYFSIIVFKHKDDAEAALKEMDGR